MSFSSIKRQEYIRYMLWLSSAVFVALSYVLLKVDKSLLSSSTLFILVYTDIISLFFTSFLIYRQIRAVLDLNSSANKGKLFYKQIITLFSCVTILPSVCVFAFSIIFFNIGIENLFRSPIKDIIENAEQVAEIYINDMKMNLEGFTNVIGTQLNTCIDGISVDQKKMQQILIEETEASKVDASVMQNIGQGGVVTLASTPFALATKLENPPRDLFTLEEGEIISWENDEFAIVATMINKALGIYMVAIAPIDNIIMEHKHKIQNALTEYSNIATQRSGIKISFITLFSVVTLLLLITSIFFGVVFTNRILRPINKLIFATKNITAGDYKSPIKLKDTKTEFDILIATFNDMMSKLEQQKQQLIISNKQNAWRDIARKIAHEIKNPLTPIQLSAERLKSKYQKEIQTNPEVFKSCIETIVRQVKCIGNLVKEFSEFARMPAPKLEKTNIIELIKQVVIIQTNAHKDIMFKHDYKIKEFFINIDPAQINQVIMNIVQNAINSIEENNVSTENIIGHILIEFSEENDTIKISIEDDGPGFSEFALEKALEPYFTTREAGTGLGLAIVHKIITDHDGEIILGKSEDLGGAKVTITLPKNFTNLKADEDGI